VIDIKSVLKFIILLNKNKFYYTSNEKKNTSCLCAFVAGLACGVSILGTRIILLEIKMKKKWITFLIAALIFIVSLPLYSEGNYEVIINGKKYNADLGKEYNIKTPKGEKIKLKILKKSKVKYEDNFISFYYKGNSSISSTDVSSNIKQIMTSTALGTLILIQEYTTMNPAAIGEIMLQELVKEELNYGYKMKKTSIQKTLKDGMVLKGLNAELTYKSEKKNYNILTYGKKDSGLIIITSIDMEYIDKDSDLIDLFWNTLKIKLK